MNTPYPHPRERDDADQLLADWGKDLVCAAAPLVTRGLVDPELIERSAGEGSAMARVVLLKVKVGSFDGIAIRGTRVDVTDEYNRTLLYTIDQEVQQAASLFDAYALQPYRP